MIKNTQSPTAIYMVRKLVMEKEDSYDLYRSGPFYAMESNDIFMKFYNDIHHPLLFYFVDVASMYLTVKDFKNRSIKKMREEITAVINRSIYRYDMYSDYVAKWGNIILDGITQTQKTQKVSESAMLNYVPIVPYGGSITYAEMSELHKTDFVSKDAYQIKVLLNQTIEDCLCDHILEILEHTTKFNINDDQDLILQINKYNAFDDKEKKEYKDVLNYNIAVYMKYNMDHNGEAIFNILNVVNTISNGGRIDVEKYIQSLSKPL